MPSLTSATPALLVIAVAAVGVLHTLVPDHWVPIALLARRQGWTRSQTARTAAIAGIGHTFSTLVIALSVWIAGALFAERFGRAVDLVTSWALIIFGAWVVVGALRELRAEGASWAAEAVADPSARRGHAHRHRHGSLIHAHWHTHAPADWHEAAAVVADSPPEHEHEHTTSSRTALLLILGSSPMVEGIPAFFAASRFGPGLIALMSAVFAVSTIATYVALCVASASGLQQLSIGPLERYGEVLSGGLIMALGIVFMFIH
ncbi:MAG TPA: hypothetical protein VFO25_03410 [Candidatus Eremiobacteraceae bacterium]|nr:hypothetical protein [Candidatus Eremiobacteraceae bacterium]